MVRYCIFCIRRMRTKSFEERTAAVNTDLRTEGSGQNPKRRVNIMKKESVFRRLLAFAVVVAMLVAMTLPALAAPNNVTFNKVDNSSVSAKLPGREAANVAEDKNAYAADEVVRVSIFLEKDSVLEAGYNVKAAGTNFLIKAYRNSLERLQENTIAKIEKTTGQDLDVVWNLTLIANVISANVAYGQIEEIESVKGVEKVLIETIYETDVVSIGVADPNMATSGSQIGSAPAWGAGFTGAGSRIAIIDTGVDVDHISFDAAAFEYSLAYRAGLAGMTPDEYKASLNLLTAAEIDKLASELNAPVTGSEAYINSKIAFGYNYLDGSLDISHMNDNQGEHGSHVSGIATANAFVPSENGFVSALDNVFVQGVAPDAQLITMKVFGKKGGPRDTDYLGAIEDAIILGADSINLSLGSGNPGRSRSSTEEFQAIMERLADTGVVVSISAGNSGHWAEETYPGYLYADDVSMHTGGSPGSFTNSLGVASVNNAGFVTGMSPIIMVGDVGVFYYDDNDYQGGGTYGNKPFSTLAGDYEYVFLNNIGTPEQFAALGEGALEGKIAMCYRGETSFFEKANAAVAADAIAVIIVNNVDENFGMNLTGYEYDAPAVSISLSSGEIFKVNPITGENGELMGWTGTLTVPDTVFTGMYPNKYYTMSSFSSWGVPQSLIMKPEITAPGGDILSVNGANKAYGNNAHDQYELMSGTSMAAPQVTGMAAILAQYIRENGLEALTGLTARQLAQSLLMSTAVPMLADASSYYPVLQQGAGLANVGAAIMADTYILMDANATASYADGKVKAELGDDPARTGKYNFSFTINNMDDVDKLYNLSADFFIQAPASGYMYTATALIGALSSFTVDGKAVTAAWDMDGADFNGDGTVNVLDGQALLDYATGLRTELTNAANADFDADGDIDSQDAYLFLAKAESLTTVPANGSVKVDVSIEIPAEWKAALDYYYPNGTYIQGYVYADGISNEEGVMGTSHSIPVLGFYGNWSDPSMFDKGSYMEYYYGLETRAPYLYGVDDSFNALAANALTILYAGDKTEYAFGGNPMIDDATYMPERNAISASSTLNKLTFTAIRNAAASRFFVADAATGELLLAEELGAVDGAYYYVNGGYWDSYGWALTAGLSFAGIPDNTKLEVGLTLAPEYYVDADGNTDWDALGKGATFSMPLVVDNTAPTLEDVSLSLTGKTLTVTASDNQYVSAVVLYNKKGTEALKYVGAKQDIEAGESAEYVLDLSEVKGSKFLLQVTDYAMNATTYEINLGGEDEPVALPGRIAFNLSKGFWTSFDGDAPTAAIIREEYEASSEYYYAAAIVDKYVFAATDGGMLHVMPLSDLTDVTVVANLGGVVSDMAYNKADGKLYGVLENVLVTIDKLTGAVTEVGTIGVSTNTLACDANGTFYCNKYGSGDVYSFTLDTIAEPTLLVNLFSQGSAYVQSMEIDPNTGKLCWAAFYRTSGLIKRNYSYYFEINLEDGTSTKSASLTDELGALIIPDMSSGGNWAGATDKVTGIQISATSLSLLRGDSAALSAIVQPWTATDRTVTWSSADEAIASVDANGVVTAIAAGETVITVASVLDPSITATCAVTVTAPAVTVSGALQDANGNSQFFSWNLETQDTWIPGVSFNSSINSITMDTLNNKAYVMSADGTSMNVINPVTGEIEQIGGNGAGVPLWDMQYSTVFSTADAPKLNAIYYYYFLPAKDPMALDTSAFNLSSLLAQTGASYLVGVSSLGYSEYQTEEGQNVDAELVMLMDNLGNLWDMYVYPVDGSFSAELYHYETGMGQYGLTFDGSGENMYCSLFASDYDNLFATVFTGDHTELYHYYYDYETYGFVGKYLGSMGDDVWPAALTGGYVNSATGTNSVARRGEVMKLDTVKVSAEELASVKVEANTMTMVADVTEDVEIVENKAPVAVHPMSAPAVSAKEDLVTIDVTAGAAATNGVSTITFDSAALELLTVNVLGDYTSINAADGSVTIGFVDLDGVAADAVIATLTFKPKNTEDTTVTIVTNELNNDKPGTEEVVEVKYPHVNTEIKDAKDATCTEEGYTGDTYCADCGKLIAKGEVIPAKGHGETEICDAKDPTCTEEGYTGDTYCTECGMKVADGEAIPATGHQHTEIKDAKDPTCTEEGYTGDTWCTDCNTKIADGEAIPAKGHGETEIKDAKDATCTEEGYTGDTYCTVCGDKVADGEAIPATGHQHTEIKDAKPATTTEEGYTGDTYCTDCGEKIAEGESIPMVDPENPKTSETRAFLMATAAVMVAAAAAVVVMLGRKKLF